MIVKDKEEKIRSAVGTYNATTDEFNDSKVVEDGVYRYRATVSREVAIVVTGNGESKSVKVPIDDMTEEQVMELIKSYVRRMTR